MALPGPFLAGQRLPAGQLNDATQKTLDSVEVGVAGVIATTSGTTELNVPELSLGPVPVVNGGLYQFHLNLTIQHTVAADEYNIFVRRDTPLTGTIVTSFVNYASPNGNGAIFVAWHDVTSAADEDVQYFLSVQRATGSGVLNVYGQLSSTNRTAFKVSRVGYSSEFRIVT